MECNLKTVVNKLKFVAAEAKKYHLEQIAKGAIQTTHVQFDEMETHEHTRMKPLSIALAVRAKMVKKSAKVSNTSEIIGFQVATMNCHGHNSAFAQLKYGIRPDTRAQACEDVLKVVAQCQKPGQTLTITTDAKSAYPAIIQKVLPSAIHNPVPNRIAHAGTAQPMFAFNSIAGKIRHDMSRMARRSWVTTKAAWALEAHLYIYLAWNNRYPIFQNRAGTV